MRVFISMIYSEININKYFGKGNYVKFKKDYGVDVYQDVFNKTTILNGTYKDNEKFTARLLFLNKYDGNIRKITKHNKIKRFDGKDFIYTANNSAEKQWKTFEEKLNKIEISNLYSLPKTIDMLLINATYLNYLGKSKNRTLQKHNLILYKSIMYHTKIFDNFNKNYNKLSHRILFLVGDLEIFCNSCGKKNNWAYIDGTLKVSCSKCKPKFPSKKWFVEKYDENWLEYYHKYFDRIKKNKTNSLEWYIKKYGINDGTSKYNKRYEDQLIKIYKLKKNRYSGISQSLFWSINDKMINNKDVYFQEKTGEYYIIIPDKYKFDSNIIFVDFKFGNKIIEYDGKYWHDPEKDLIRDNILKDLGFEVLRVSSDEYSRNNKSEKVIDKCLKFILDDD